MKNITIVKVEQGETDKSGFWIADLTLHLSNGKQYDCTFNVDHNERPLVNLVGYRVFNYDGFFMAQPDIKNCSIDASLKLGNHYDYY